MALTTTEVLELAPDPSSKKAGQDLAQARKWLVLARDGDIAWGEIKGSGASPYRTAVDTSTAVPAYKCSCPSRKFPCKHGLGLMLIGASSPNALSASNPPDWVATWVTSRSARAAAASAPPKPVDEVAQAKRRAERESKVDAGVAELQLWLADIARRGVASLKSEPYAFWDRMGARLVDAQAPNLARRVRDLVSLVGRADDTFFESLGRLQLLVHAWNNVESLTPLMQSDLRSAVGFNLAVNEGGLDITVTDTWTVLACDFDEVDDKLRERKTWLYGHTEQKIAALIDYAAGTRPFPPAPLPGSSFAGALQFYPSVAPLRAVIKGQAQPAEFKPFGGTSIAEALELVSAEVSKLPWVDEVPVMLQSVSFGRSSDKTWAVSDGSNAISVVSANNIDGFIAASGGKPVNVFGLWGGAKFRLLAMISQSRLYSPALKSDAPYVRLLA